MFSTVFAVAVGYALGRLCFERVEAYAIRAYEFVRDLFRSDKA